MIKDPPTVKGAELKKRKTTANIITDLELIVFAAREPSKGFVTTPEYSLMETNLMIIDSIAQELIRDLKGES